MSDMVKRILNRLNGSERIKFALQEALAEMQARFNANFEALQSDGPAAITNLNLHRARLRDQYGSISLKTDKSVAYDSPDHIEPWGTKQDNHRNVQFNRKLNAWIPSEDLRLLDLGCSGGGQVRSFVEQGCLAVGIEGSDYSLKRLRAEWGTIPELLFTADITAPFELTASGKPLQFSVITLWEVIEHIHRRDLPALFSNLDRHLAPNGVIVMSVSTVQDTINGVDLHQTVEGPEWWYRTFSDLDFRDHPNIVRWFGNDFVRWEENAAGSFHVILTRAGEAPIHAARITRYLGRDGATTAQTGAR
jgi:2-polyprenyl-3-methyl-5-hydroxy-6-metoxy-1,4-benzoquinol methylase